MGADSNAHYNSINILLKMKEVYNEEYKKANDYVNDYSFDNMYDNWCTNLFE